MTSRDMTIETIHNLYKSAYGVKARHIDFDQITDCELDALVLSVAKDAEEQIEWEGEHEVEQERLELQYEEDYGCELDSWEDYSYIEDQF